MFLPRKQVTQKCQWNVQLIVGHIVDGSSNAMNGVFYVAKYNPVNGGSRVEFPIAFILKFIYFQNYKVSINESIYVIFLCYLFCFDFKFY